MICRQCGASCRDGAKFCPHCGLRFDPDAASQTRQTQDQNRQAQPRNQQAPAVPAQAKEIEAQTEKKKSRLPMILGVLLVLAVLAAAAILLLPKLLGGKNQTDTTEASAASNTQESGGQEADASETELLTDTEAPETTETVDPAAAVLEEAEQLAAAEEYEQALAVVEEALRIYPDREDLLARQAEYAQVIFDRAKTELLDLAEEAASREAYMEAVTILAAEEQTFGEDQAYLDAAARYRKAFEDQALAEAEALAEAADYLNAIKKLEEAASFLQADADSPLTIRCGELTETYVDAVIAEAWETLQAGDYSGAERIITAALKELPDHERLTQELSLIRASKPVSITTLDILNCDEWLWNEGAPTDPFGNDYSDKNNYLIQEQTYDWGEQNYAEYRLYGQYAQLTGMLAAYTGTGENGYGWFQVYADEVLIYSSPLVVRKTDAFTFSIDVTNADYLKLVISLGGHSAVILSDVLLYPQTDPAAQEQAAQEAEKAPVSIMTKTNINQSGWEWDNGFPQDMVGSDYTGCCNYAILTQGYTWAETFYTEYRLYREYQSVTGRLAPYPNMSEKSEAYLKIYADDVLVYTSPMITRKTDYVDFDVDIAEADYIKFVFEAGGSSSTILSDVKVVPVGSGG